MHIRRITAAGVAALMLSVGLAACAPASDADPPPSDAKQRVSILAVNNIQWVDVQELLPEFEKATGIDAEITLLPENDFRAKVTQELSANAKQYDVVSLSNYEVPIYAANGWLEPVDEIAADPDYDQGDIFPMWTDTFTVDGKLYAEPFTGESSDMMYRKDFFDAHGLVMPEKPTWEQVRDLAAQVEAADPTMNGICLRGKPGWSEMFAILGPMVNTFGGTWFDKDWNAHVNEGGFKDATEFYVNLIKDYGPEGSSEAGYAECYTSFTQGQSAMWVDDAASANVLESDGEPLQGKLGYALAPVKLTESGGMLYSWGWSVQKGSPNADAAMEFVKWSTSKEYDALVAEKYSWVRVPSMKRYSTSENPAYVAETAAFNKVALDSILAADPNNPGTEPRPVPGVQFLVFPEFADMATNVSIEISDAIAGRQTVDEALDKGQQFALEVTTMYQE